MDTSANPRAMGDENPPAKRQRQEPGGEAPKADAAMIRRMLHVIEHEMLPKTEKGVSEGNKVFGAAILDGREQPTGSEVLPTVIAETNHETLCPLYHGEVYAIKQWSETIAPADRPSPADSVFLSSHEPCCMCISSIVWCGFKKAFYFFPYETTREQGIPHDLAINQELWRCTRYATPNKFCATAGLFEQIDACSTEEKAEFQPIVERISKRYDELSNKYHTEKVANPKNTLAFG